jgi:uncharacterized membrane protein
MDNNKKQSLSAKLDKILENEKKILSNQDKIIGEEKKLEELEMQELEKEDKSNLNEEETLRELESLKSQITSSISSPIKNITKKDMAKGFIGATVGVMSHFAFVKGAELSTHITFFRASLLYLVAIVIIIMLLYYTGFRKIEKHIILKFMPLRALVLYTVSIITILIVNLLFGQISFDSSFNEVYMLVGTSIILAVMGAGTADLIGRE